MKESGYKPTLGDPLDAVAYQNQVDDTPTTSSSDGRGKAQSAGLREKDTGLGLPDFEPTADEQERIRDVPKEEVEKMLRERDDLEDEFEKKLQEIQQAGIKIPRFVYSFVAWTLVFIGAVLGLFIVNQGVAFFASVSSLTPPWSYLATGIVITLLILILIVLGKVFRSFIVLRKNTKIDLRALNVLAERQRLRNQACKKKDEARRELTTYLKEHPLENNPAIRLGLAKEELANLKKHKNNLLGDKAYIDSSQWLNEFNASVVFLMDSAAGKRIRLYVKSVSIGTAASPIKLIDQMIVLYASFNLINELMQIYNLKPAFGQSATILARSVIHAYLSGVIGENVEGGIDFITDNIESFTSDIGMSGVADAGVSGAASLGSGFVGALAPKIAEGGLNGLLIWRLGSQARKMLRPM